LATRAEKRRRKLARIADAARSARRQTPAPAERTTGRVVDVDRARKADDRKGRDDGLDFLAGRGRLNGRQAGALRKYGGIFRTAQISSATSIRSCIALLGRVSGGEAPGGPTSMLEAEAWIAESRIALARARSDGLGEHVEMIAICDMVAGRGMAPREIFRDSELSDAQVQRAADEVETTLRVAGDLLARHFELEARRAREASDRAR